jgi:hypothetical protein
MGGCGFPEDGRIFYNYYCRNRLDLCSSDDKAAVKIVPSRLRILKDLGARAYGEVIE